ncbi:MAG: hypothetical protein H7839_24510 [Magnetococcus sp. YQC-5]
MLTTFAILIISAVFIYLACEFFVNGVEWLGRKIGVAETATGTILAAFGTALPESVVTIVAVLGQGAEQKAIGVGAALAGPMVLSTITYGVVGLVMIYTVASKRTNASRVVRANYAQLTRDQAWFQVIFVLKVLMGIALFAYKAWLGTLFLLAYAIYVWVELRAPKEPEEEGEEYEPLKFQPKAAVPSMSMTLVQCIAALVVIFYASHTFVGQLEAIGHWLNMPSHVIALILSPLATELPETINALIWVRQGKEKLALANVSGAMMIQATIPTAFGIFYTPWLFDGHLFVSAGVTMAAMGVLFYMFRRGDVTGKRLAFISLMYLPFMAYVLFRM